MKSNTRPRIVTWLALGVLTLSIVFTIRLFLSFRMPDLSTFVPQWYLSLTGLVWGLGGLILSYGLFRTRSWSQPMLRWGSITFMIWYWIDRLSFMRSDYSRVSWPASLALSLVALGVIFWIQNRPEVYAAFQENDQ